MTQPRTVATTENVQALENCLKMQVTPDEYAEAVIKSAKKGGGFLGLGSKSVDPALLAEVVENARLAISYVAETQPGWTPQLEAYWAQVQKQASSVGVADR